MWHNETKCLDRRTAASTREEEEETGKVMSGDDFHIREVLKRGRFYNILLLQQLLFQQLVSPEALEPKHEPAHAFTTHFFRRL